MLDVLAPAKLNLTLEVLAKRQDGFHEIRSVIQTIDLCDSLRFHLSQNIEVNSNEPNWTLEDGLVFKAASLVQRATGCATGATIQVNKRIPVVSGLGGASSDAAAVLHGLNKLWELGLSQRELLELAAQLSSDVAFFLYGGTALVEGRGELVTPLPSLPHTWVILVVPPVPRIEEKTKQLYASLKPKHYTEGQITAKLAALLTEGREITPSVMFNVFDVVAPDSFRELGKYRQQLLQAGAQEVHLAGSGPALFTLVKDRIQAEKLYRHLQEQGIESYLTSTSVATEQVE